MGREDEERSPATGPSEAEKEDLLTPSSRPGLHSRLRAALPHGRRPGGESVGVADFPEKGRTLLPVFARGLDAALRQEKLRVGAAVGALSGTVADFAVN